MSPPTGDGDRRQQTDTGITSLPSTRLGWWSFGLLLGFMGCFLAQALLVSTGFESGQSTFADLVLVATGLGALVSVLSALVVGIVAVVRRGERSVATGLAVLVGTMVVASVVGGLITGGGGG